MSVRCNLDRELLLGGATLLLHWGVLLEIGDGYARLGRRAKGIELLKRFQQEQGYQIVPITDAFLASAVALYSGRVDKDWGMTDCLSFVIMQQHEVTEALTADRHFVQAGFQALLLSSPTDG